MQRLVRQRAEEPVNLVGVGNVLLPRLGIGQVDHPRRVLLDDLILLRVREDGGDGGEVFLYGRLLDRLSAREIKD